MADSKIHDTTKYESDEEEDEQTSMPANFFDQALFWLTQTYPDWKNTMDSESGQTESICIPDCLDIGPHKFYSPTKCAAGFNKEEVKRAKSRLKGERGEETFFTEFRKLKLGGMLIHGFYTSDFNKVMKDREIVGFVDIENDEQQFECDFIFIHQRYGVVAIEVKGCDGEQEMPSQFKRAADQLNYQLPGLEVLFKRLTGESHCPFKVQGVVCMPNFNIETAIKSNKKLELESKFLFKLIDKSLLLNSDYIRQFWEEIQMHGFLFTDASIKFLVALFAYRSAKFMSGPLNALEIYRRIENQDFRYTKTKLPTKQTIIFNNEQLKAVECTSQRVLISGPPGTGKTLCLIQKALSLADVDKPGNVILALVDTPDLEAKFRQICRISKCSAMKRPPLIQTIFNFNRLSADDDLFFDEMFVTNLISLHKKFTDRPLKSGSTTVAITGWISPAEAKKTRSVQERYLVNYEHFELKTVIRGTKTIIEEWKSVYNDPCIRIGHNITGTSIERYSVVDVAEMLEIVASKIASLLIRLPKVEAAIAQRSDSLRLFDSPSLQQCFPRDIAVLTTSTIYDEKIRAHLTKRGIRCGPVQKQTRDSRLIAVGHATNALSFEWPIVIVVAIAPYCRTLINSEYLIATSRAIAKLIVIDVPSCCNSDDDLNSLK